MAHVANAFRAFGHLIEAGEIFDDARFLLRGEGGVDCSLAAELDELEGSLRRAQRRFREAETLLKRAVISYKLEQQDVDAARALITLCSVRRVSGNPVGAAQAATEALELLGPSGQPRLSLFARHNLALCLCESGQYDDAQELATENAPLFARFGDPLSRLRFAWLEGLIARGRGEVLEAESALLAVR